MPRCACRAAIRFNDRKERFNDKNRAQDTLNFVLQNWTVFRRPIVPFRAPRKKAAIIIPLAIMTD